MQDKDADQSTAPASSPQQDAPEATEPSWSSSGPVHTERDPAHSDQQAAEAASAPDTSKADGIISNIDSRLFALSSQSAEFQKARDSYASINNDLDQYDQAAISLGYEELETKNNQRKAHIAIDAARAELASAHDRSIFDVLSGSVSIQELDECPDMLQYVIDVEEGIIEEQSLVQKETRSKRFANRLKRNNRNKVIESARSNACAAAYAIERTCAQLRQFEKEAKQLLQDMGDTDPALDDVRARLLSSIDRVSAAAGSADSLVGTFYDELDTEGSAEGAISYGEGADFALEEEVFVEKWGAAIDAFYADYGDSGAKAPLEGYGRQMAKAAYAYRIDPRLCAAVSIAESGGGRVCIRNANAWGWGAADRDPYHLASEWSSFDESIEAWHKGMAESKTGLATAPSVSALGTVYCSSPIWGETVITYMEQISSYVR